jgi:hypothetical protein
MIDCVVPDRSEVTSVQSGGICQYVEGASVLLLRVGALGFVGAVFLGRANEIS